MENTMKEIQFLKGERVYLRPFTEEDTDFFDVWYNDALTRAKIAAPYPTTAAQSLQCVQRSGHDCIWLGIATCEKHEVIGEIGLLRMYPAWGTSDLTIIIPHEAHQGKGYGTEAIRLLMDYAFGDLGFHRLAIGVVGFNTDALRFYKKNGFKKEGIQEDGYYYHYEYHNFIMMRILKEEFLQLIRQK